jgi:hypothetical protein
MIAILQKPTKAPIQRYCLPISLPNAPTVPERVLLPIPNSMMIKGIDQVKRKIIQGIINDPPPFWAIILGNRQMLPVPIAIPRTDNMRARRDVKKSCLEVSLAIF